METLPGYDAWKTASPDDDQIEDEPECQCCCCTGECRQGEADAAEEARGDK